MASGKTYHFTVQGSGEFPYDMLRYDECWPWYGEDSSRLSAHHRDRRRVVLMSCSQTAPTDERWKSFGWQVVHHGYPENVHTHRDVNVPLPHSMWRKPR